MQRVLKTIERLFPLLALGFAVAAFIVPGPFLPVKGYINRLLGLIMFSMGATLAPDDFLRAVRRWKIVLLGAGYDSRAYRFAE